MGHSTTCFHGVGFTTKDWKLELWMHLLAQEIDQIPNAPEWLGNAADVWREQATLAINGCIHMELDAYLINADRTAVVRKLAQKVYSSLHSFGESLPRNFLNGTDQPTRMSQYQEDMKTELFLAPGRALLKLLDGKMKTNELA